MHEIKFYRENLFSFRRKKKTEHNCDINYLYRQGQSVKLTLNKNFSSFAFYKKLGKKTSTLNSGNFWIEIKIFQIIFLFIEARYDTAGEIRTN